MPTYSPQETIATTLERVRVEHRTRRVEAVLGALREISPRGSVHGARARHESIAAFTRELRALRLRAGELDRAA